MWVVERGMVLAKHTDLVVNLLKGFESISYLQRLKTVPLNPEALVARHNLTTSKVTHPCKTSLLLPSTCVSRRWTIVRGTISSSWEATRTV